MDRLQYLSLAVSHNRQLPSLKKHPLAPRKEQGEFIRLKVGCCSSSTNYAEKLEQKMRQYAELRQHLKAAVSKTYGVAWLLVSGVVLIKVGHQLIDLADLLSHNEYE